MGIGNIPPDKVKLQLYITDTVRDALRRRAKREKRRTGAELDVILCQALADDIAAIEAEKGAAHHEH